VEWTWSKRTGPSAVKKRMAANGVAIGAAELAWSVAVGIELLLLADLGEVGLAGEQRAARVTDPGSPEPPPTLRDAGRTSPQFFLLVSGVTAAAVSFAAVMVESFFVESGMTAAVESVDLVESPMTAFGDGAPPAAGSGLEQPASSAPTAIAAAREEVRMRSS
jgi:hypothetical protein